MDDIVFRACTFNLLKCILVTLNSQDKKQICDYMVFHFIVTQMDCL